MKNFIKFLLILFVFFKSVSIVLAQEQIQSFSVNITVNKDGKMGVIENIEYDFSNLERHGIYRDIPFVTTNKAGKKFRLEFNNFQVTDEIQKYKVEKSIVNQKIRLQIGDPNKTITGIHKYIISYEVAGALTYFSDHDELYWNATGNDWNVPIKLSTVQVELPFVVGENEIKYICYTGPAGSSEQDCSSIVTGSTANIKTERPLTAYEGLTIAVSFPKGRVAVLEAKPYLTFWETIWGKITLGLIIVAAILWYIVYPIWIPIKWLRQGRDPSTSSLLRQGYEEQAELIQGVVTAWFDPPRTVSGRRLTPEETGALVDERVDMSDISAMLVSLAQRGFIKIEERKKGDFYLVKKNEYLNSVDLIPLEISFLRELFRSESEYHLQKNKLYKTVEDAKQRIYERLVADGFFPENPDKIRNFYTAIGVAALTTFNIALAFSAFFFGRHMPRKTPFGSAKANEVKSLRNFLSSQKRQLKFQADKQLMFEKLLPYAVAFGVEKIWAERFKDVQLKEPEWYTGYGSQGRFNSVIFTRSLNSSFASVRSAATPVSSSTGHGSGFSGGSSGGGGGGGGGGSW